MPYDDAEIERLSQLGYTPETDPTVGVAGPGPVLFFQEVPQKKACKNRLHLDIEADDRSSEVGRLVSLGATVHEEFDTWTVLLDPEGNEFCVADPR